MRYLNENEEWGHEDAIGMESVCRGCVEAVQRVIDFDAADGEEEFDDGFGDLIDDLHGAAWALHRTRRERFTDRHDEVANSHEAAATLVRISAAVKRLILRGVEIADD